MNKNLIKISTVGMPHDDWLAYRTRSIGGSDAAVLWGGMYVFAHAVYAIMKLTGAY